MNRETTQSRKSFLLEISIYIVLIAIYFYLKSRLGNNQLPLFDYRSSLWTIIEFLQGGDGQIIIVLGLLIVATILFALEKLSVDIITLLLLVALVAFRVLTPQEAFAGFSNDIIIILASIFVISAALQQTGVMDALVVYLSRIAGASLSRLMVILMVLVGGISMFMNNTTATAIFIPPTMGIAKRTAISPSKLLIPLAYASILGGTATLIGTSTNVAVSGYIAQLGLEPIGLFELLPIGLIILSVGILYMLLISKYLLPSHTTDHLADDQAIREYLSEVIVTSDSNLVGQKVLESDLAELDFQILAVIRGQRKFRPNIRSKIEAGDILLVQGKADELIKIKETTGIEIETDLHLKISEAWSGNDESSEIKIAEVLIIPKSDLIGQRLKSVNFLQKYGLTVLAIYRHGQSLRDKIGRIKLQLGDLLLVQGPTEYFESLRRSSDFWIMEELSPLFYRKRKGLCTLIFLMVAITVGGLGWLPLSIAFLGAAVMIILFRCITIEEAYGYIDWRLIILIGGMTAFGVAMEKTGAAQFLADWIVYGLEPYGIVAVMVGFSLLTILLTQPMSNAAAALVVLPVALHAAQGLGVNERTFAIVVMLAASISLVTPFEPACILVYGPGKYKFRDFIKTGIGLTLILNLLILLLIPVFWPL